jgi:hypothetical protein
VLRVAGGKPARPWRYPLCIGALRPDGLMLTGSTGRGHRPLRATSGVGINQVPPRLRCSRVADLVAAISSTRRADVTHLA